MATKKSNGKAKTTKSTAAKGAKTKRPRNLEIPGTERKVHGDVREAAEAYVEVRDERQALTAVEVEKKGALMALMKKHDLTQYIDEDAEIEVEVVPVDETVKVKKWKPKAKPTADDAGVVG